jgi:prepilin-type N-terminal cleavage/methylation domain-containing protein
MSVTPKMPWLARRQPKILRKRGFTQLELLIVIGIIAVLLAFLLPVIGKVRRSARSVSCLSQLHQIVLAFQQYTSDNHGRLPDPLAADVSWEEMLIPYAHTPALYQCPADDELADSLGSSYDWRDTGDPTTTLAGAPITDGKSDTVLVFDTLPNWHAKGRMNAALIDGSSSSMDTSACLGNVMKPLRAAQAP